MYMNINELYDMCVYYLGGMFKGWGRRDYMCVCYYVYMHLGKRMGYGGGRSICIHAHVCLASMIYVYECEERENNIPYGHYYENKKKDGFT